MGKKKNFYKNYKNNYGFIDNLLVNDLTYIDYLNRFKRVALSMFEWVNLPKSMDGIWLERCLYYDGMATLLKSEKYGYINTKCTSNGQINLYGLPTSLHCYSFDFQTNRKLYTGITSEEKREQMETNECILVRNNWEFEPTAGSMELFALRLYEAERTSDVNVKAQKTPVLLIVDEAQRLMMENLYSQYDGNRPFIFGDKNQLSDNTIRAVNTGAEFVADKLQDYKKEIWNEALTFLGINNIMVDKKERLITDEANSNNELINMNLQSFLAPRQLACDQFNEKFGLKGTDKEISVRVRSDLHNIIKNAQSIITDYKNVNDLDNKINEKGEVLENG